MKIKIFALILTSLFACHYAFSQKYRTLEQYQDYFIKNYKSIDKIEGIWYSLSTQTINNIVKQVDPEVVAIIKEGESYKQYTLKDGLYVPISGTRVFMNTTSGYQYNRYYEEEGKTNYGEAFYLYDNSVFDIVKTLKPSKKRNELEISDVNNVYLKNGNLKYQKLKGRWADAGESLAAYNKAIVFARRMIEKGGADRL